MINQKVDIDTLTINTIRTLAIDVIEKAGSGHPGMPMGAAPMAYVLWSKIMNYNPNNPNWFNRDRFVLSAGHGSMLLYSLLHLTGYDLSKEELLQFRQWGSKTPGHPEFGHTPGVDATTGPLGQGIAMSVGMAMAERHLAATYNREELNVVDHYVYSICGDGDLMEGVSGEAASLAGHLKLGKLIVLYDSNDISLDGDLSMSFTESVESRFKAYGWEYYRIENGNDIETIQQVLEKAKENKDQPTLIEIKTIIGYGSPNKGGKSDSHGSPLGIDEIQLVKQSYDWSYDQPYYIPNEVSEYFEKLKNLSAEKEAMWNHLFKKYREIYPNLAEQLSGAIKDELPENWDKDIPKYSIGEHSLATRTSSGEVLQALAKNFPSLFGGSADLASSNKTLIKNGGDFLPDNYKGRNIWFGVREFAMGAILNGLALHGGIKAFGATFFVFSDYLRPAIRLSALMKLPVIYIFTHDSIAVGEDGPTHEPIEQLASLRAMPGLSTIRPADGNETAAAWKLAVESKDVPTALILTRQNLPTLVKSDHAYVGVNKGAYVISKRDKAVGLLLASGSEVALAIEAQRLLEEENIIVSVVSMPSWDLFEKQSNSYKETIIPNNITARLALEMGSSQGWHRYIGNDGKVIGIDKFGTSAPGERIIEEYGFTPENVVTEFKKLL
ncbi:transketolase [Niallia sp. FSL W8-0635]|uniref:transketolase n=1 Tax=Niallia sp. FSL W8-0635 TaxID=2975337 RepID=UPI0009CFFC7C|nr:transketolase [Mycobacteroides abscessus subsp. abscessus]HEO8418767.1 transketolase [Yersinia enterocolitica]HEO8422812.1 transketolase [Yersinia enterocolitica]